MNNNFYYQKIAHEEDTIHECKKKIHSYKKKLKEQAERDANYEGYYIGSCFRTKNGVVLCITDINYKRYVLLDEWIVDIEFTCRKVNKSGYFDKREITETKEILRGMDKILHEDQEIVFKENLNGW